MGQADGINMSCNSDYIMQKKGKKIEKLAANKSAWLKFKTGGSYVLHMMVYGTTSMLAKICGRYI